MEEEGVVCLLVLTSDGCLKVLDAHTGAVLRVIYVGTSVVFRYGSVGTFRGWYYETSHVTDRYLPYNGR